MMNLYTETSLARARQRELLVEAQRDRLAAEAVSGKPALYNRLLAIVGRAMRAPYARLVVPGQPVTNARMTLGAHHQ